MGSDCCCARVRIPSRWRARRKRHQAASCHRTPLLLLTLIWLVGCTLSLDASAALPPGPTTAPLVALWDTAHTGTMPTSASHSLLRGDQPLVTFIDKMSGEVTSADLAAVNLYVLVEPDSKDLAPAEIAAIQDFMTRGGSLLLLADSSPNRPGVNSLLAGSGISLSNDFAGGMVSTTDVTSHTITTAVASVYVASGGKSLVVTSPSVSCVRYVGQTIVAASDLGSHRIVAIGDETSFQDQDGGTPPAHYFKANNRTLIRNIFNWFRRGGSRGHLSLDAAIYASTSTVRIELTDTDLASAPSATVAAQSSRGDSETVALAARGAGYFEGNLALTPATVVLGNGWLSVADGTIVTVTYHDMNNGAGVPGDVRTTAVVDARPPTIRNVRVSRIGPFTARVRWETDEPATARVRFGLTATATTRTVERADLRTSHTLELRWLEPETTYFYIVESRDGVGNLRVENAGGTGYSFTTCRTRQTNPLIRVLLLYSDAATAGILDIKAKLLADGRIAQVDHWDYHAALPTLAELRSYDVVLAHANYDSPNRNALGDLLADSVESSGPVVTLNQATVEPFAIGGRFRTRGYGVFVVSSSYQQNQPATLGAIHAPAHPLLDDVASFDGGPWSAHQTMVALTTDSLCVADWSDGEPLVAYRIIGITRLVGLNFFGPSSDVSPELWNSATDGASLIANALVWATRRLDCDSWATPRLRAEPAFTRGTTNTIIWEDFAQAEQVEIEWSQNGFVTVAGRSGWLAESLHQWTAAGLADGQTYAYRLCGRSGALGLSPFSNVVTSTQDATPPLTSIAALPTTTTGAVVTLRISGADAVSGVQAADVYWRRGSTGPFQWFVRLTTLPQSCAFDTRQHGGPGSYQFMARGTDRAGNVESKSQADARTFVDWGNTAARAWKKYGR